MLTHFGYDKDLKIDRKVWDDKSIDEQVFKSARSFGLTSSSVGFLRKLFNKYKIDSQQGQAILDH